MKNLNIPDTQKKRVLVIGAGFGGLNAVERLDENLFQVVVIDRNNYHCFQPLLYQVATSGLEPDAIAESIRTLIKNRKDTYFRYTKVLSIEKEAKYLKTEQGDITYDYLVIATGAGNNFLGNKNFEEKTLPMKSIPEALNLRSKILESFEKACFEIDAKERCKLMTFVIIGGGATGVEIAGAISEFKNYVLPKEYPDLDFSKMRVCLIHSRQNVLDGMSKKSMDKAKLYLEEEGVEVFLGKRVQEYDGDTIKIKEGCEIPANTVIWAAGVKGNIINGFKAEQIIDNRYRVNQYNLVEGEDNVFAIGDVACMESKEYNQGHPMVAQPAIQQGKVLSKNLNALAIGENLKKFKYKNKGSMATIGRHKAVVDLPRMTFTGSFAWFVWIFVHLMSIVNFRSRVVAFTNWVVQYFSYNKSVRLIITKHKKTID